MSQSYQEIQRLLQQANDAYYDNDAPIMTDEEYDKLNRRAQEMEKADHGLITPTSNTQKVGGKQVLGIAVEHKVPMLSLMDVFDKESIYDFVNEIKEKYPDATFSTENKCDGLSLSCLYGRALNDIMVLTQASTRGDGKIGQDVTTNVMALPSLPKQFPAPDSDCSFIELRGECYMSEEDFDRTNKAMFLAGKKLFANPRNCAAGTLRQTDPAVVAERNLQVLVFNVQDCDGRFMQKEHYQQLAWLGENGFNTTLFPGGEKCEGKEDVWNAIEKIGEGRSALGFPIDGAVVKVNDLAMREKIGERTKSPKWAVAYKYPAEEKASKLLRIELQTGRTGRVTPVAVFEPIQLAGTSVERATLNNQAFIDSLDIRLGDYVVVHKSGDIIPKITGIESYRRTGKEKSFKITTCPVCGAPVAPQAIKDGEMSVDLYCTNVDCPAKVVQRVIHFSSRPCMDIKGLGEKAIEALCEVPEEGCYTSVVIDQFRYGNVDKYTVEQRQSIANIFNRVRNCNVNIRYDSCAAESDEIRDVLITDTMVQDIRNHGYLAFSTPQDNFILNVERIKGIEMRRASVVNPVDLYSLTMFELETACGGKKSAENVKKAIEASKIQSADRVLKALGYPMVGGHVARALLETYGSILTLASVLAQDLAARSFDGIAETTTAAVVDMLENQEFTNEVNTLNDCGVNLVYQTKATTGSAFTGRTFVITGTLPTMKRDEAKALIEANGGKVSGSVSKNTSYLLAGEAAGSKLTKADSLGVPVISEGELRKMLEN